MNIHVLSESVWNLKRHSAFRTDARFLSFCKYAIKVKRIRPCLYLRLFTSFCGLTIPLPQNFRSGHLFYTANLDPLHYLTEVLIYYKNKYNSLFLALEPDWPLVPGLFPGTPECKNTTSLPVYYIYTWFHIQHKTITFHNSSSYIRISANC